MQKDTNAKAADIPVCQRRVDLGDALEMGIFHPSGDRKSSHSPMDVVNWLQIQPVEWLPLSIHETAQSLGVPIPHKDPFDAMLLIQAQVHGLKLLTRDKLLQTHPLAYFV